MCPPWLPPLNSHEEYLTTVRIDKAEKFRFCRTDRQLCEYKQREGKGEHKDTVHLCVQFKCTVRFFPKDYENVKAIDNVDEEIGFPGLLLDKWFEFDVECSRREDLLQSCHTVKEFIKLMLEYLNIYWKLYPICFAGEVNGYSNHDYFLEDEHSLAHAIISVLSVENTRNTDFIPLRLHFFKHVRISDDEYTEWKTWFQKKNDVDPNFRTEYERAIRRPRNIDELIYEMQMKNFKSASESYIQELNETRNFDAKSSTDCSICIENICEESVVVNLPCSHVFHKSCIIKWLEQSHVCPLCRFSLPICSAKQ